jgi:hypothetical protein
MTDKRLSLHPGDMRLAFASRIRTGKNLQNAEAVVYNKKGEYEEVLKLNSQRNRKKKTP